jgi:hypothetical protein
MARFYPPEFAVVALLAIAAAPCCGAEPPMPPLDPNEFALMPWGSITGPQEVFDGIRDCGFNTAGFVFPHELDRAHKAGLKAIVHDKSIHVSDSARSLDDATVEKRIRELARRTANHPATWGYYLRDEPSASLYPALARATVALRKEAPGKLPYINLFPLYVPASVFPTAKPTYEGYLEEFATVVKPDFISYDNYSLMDNGTLRDGYFQNLEMVRAAALRHALPFWNIVLGNSHFHYAEPTPATLRFQAYTTLAYGARGLSYFTYLTPAIGNYRLAPVDQFGNRTPTWDAMRQVNLQVRMLAPTYVRLKSVNVFHQPDVPTSCTGIATSRFVESVTGGGSMVVGEFEGPEGEPYAMVVNKDYHRSTEFGIRFKSKGAVNIVSAYTGKEEAFAGENGWLAPGQGMLLHLKPQKEDR